jgi:outer membrane receptor protein involved in Fe transport
MMDQYRNLGRQGSRGFEATYRLRTNVARLEANYSFYKPTAADDTPPYIVPGHPEQFMAAPAHHGSFRATFWPWQGFGISPSAVILGQRYTRGVPDSMGAATATALPATVLANLYIYRDNVGVPGLTVGLGLYNIFGANYSYVHAAAATTYAGDQAPLPGLDREVMLRLTYRFDPTADPSKGSLALDNARAHH